MTFKTRMPVTARTLALTLGALLAAFQIGQIQAQEGKPNILLIVADDLGYSDLGSYGGEINTPNLDSLAQQGLQLTQFYAAPTCSPTRSMLMSGTDNHLAGLGTMAEALPSQPHLQGQPGYEGYLNERVHWLPALLQDAGYRTLMVGKWHLGRNAEQWPITRGFDRSFVLLDGGASHFKAVAEQPTVAENRPYVRDDRLVEYTELPDDFFSSDYYTDQLIDYLKDTENSGKPFFAYAAYTAPHWPLQAPDEYLDKYAGVYDQGYDAVRLARIERMKALGVIADDFVPASPLPVSERLPGWEQLDAEQQRYEARKMEVYAAMVDNLDVNIGRLFSYLKDSGQYDNTLIVFISDNGAAGEDHKVFFKDGPETDDSYANLGRVGSNVNYGRRWAEVGAAPFYLTKSTTAEGGISVPALIKAPVSMRQQGLVTATARVDDLAPTFLELAGVGDPGDSFRDTPRLPITGRSMLPLLVRGEPVHGEQPELAGQLFGNAYYRQGDWKLLSASPGFSPTGLPESFSWRLFNLADDRGETTDLSARYPERVAAMKQAWWEYAKQVGIVFPGGMELGH